MFKIISNRLSSLPVLFAVAVSFNPKLVKQTDTCAGSKDPAAPRVYVVKQWHLAPGVNTKTSTPSTALPQAKNQTQIYEQLSEWAKSDAIDTAIAEGCEGKIGPELKDAFQGWTYSDLEAHAKDANFSEILAHPVLKLQVKYPKQIKGICGDNLAEIKKSQMALSDARADVGYFSKISENQNNPQKLKPYLEGVIEMYGLKKDAGYADALKAVAKDLKNSLDTFRDSTHARDVSFVSHLASAASKKPAVLVVGGLHAADLKELLEKKKMNCVIFEPLAYQNDEEALSKKLQEMLK